MDERIFILDGHYLIYRSYHAMKSAGLKDSSGRPTGAVFGLLRFLIRLQKEYEPDYLVCALDSKEPTFRHEFFEDYKANRPDMPDDLRSQISRIKEIFELLEVPVLLEPGLESDDLIAGLVKKWKRLEDREIVIVSNDKDLFQLVSEKVSVLKQSRGLTDVKLLDAKEVEQELGVVPQRVPDYLALTGDSADNVPGVAGIGDAYAVKLLEEYADVEEILENSERIEGHLGKKIRQEKEQLRESFELVKLRSDCEIDFDLEDCRFEPENISNLVDFCAELELNSVLREIKGMFRGKEKSTAELEIDFEFVPAADLAKHLRAEDFEGIFIETDAAETKIVAAETIYLMLVRDSRVIATAVEGTSGRQLFEQAEKILNEVFCYFFGLKKYYALGYKLGLQPSLVAQPMDLKLASYLLSPEAGHNLEDVVRRQVGVGETEPEQKKGEKWLKWRGTLFARLLQAGRAITERLQEDDQRQILDDLEQPLSRELALMEHNGVKINTEHLENISDELVEIMATLEEKAFKIVVELFEPEELDSLRELIELVGGEFNLNSPTQLRYLLFEKLDLPVLKETASGKPSTAKGVLEKLRHRLQSQSQEYSRSPDNNNHATAGLQQTGCQILELILAARDAESEEKFETIETEVLARLREIYNLNEPQDLQDFFRQVGGEFNLNSQKQLRSILFEKLDLTPQGRTDSGEYSTDVDVLKELQGEHELVDILLEYRKYEKIESTYLLPLVRAVNKETGRLHTEFNQTVTATGRLSSSNPNLQNIPVREEFGRRVREAFVPSQSNYLFVAADYSQVELRLLAHFSGDETLVDAFREGRDVHRLTAAELSDKTVEEVDETDRRTAKVVNFGIAYGLSEYGLARDLNVSQKEAEEYIEKYFSRYSGVKRYIEEVTDQARENGYVKTLYGRRRYVPEINSDDYFRRQFARRSAINAPIQGTAADLIKKATIELAAPLTEYDHNMLLQIHDELLLEAELAQVQEVSATVEKRMCEAVELDVPLAVEIKVGANWAEVSK